MAKNLTNIHGKLDRILERLSKLDTQTMTYERRSANQTRLMTQMLGELVRIANATSLSVERTTEAVAKIAEMQANTQNILHDVAFMANEARKEAKEAKERVIELSSGSRRH